MPRRPGQLALRRRGRYAGGVAVAGALARGARYAYQNRQVIQDASRAARRGMDRLVANWKKKRTGYTQKQSSSTVGQQYGGGNDLTVSRAKVGGYAKKPTLPRLQRLLRIGMNYQVYRFQNITNYDTNVGGLPLPNWGLVSGSVMMPIHVYDLTSFNNVSSHNGAKYYNWASTLAGAAVNSGALPGQTSTGAADAFGYWNLETKGGVNPTTTFPNASKFVHNWTDVRINFYGPRKRTTWFEVLFVRVKDEFANPIGSSSTNAELKELMRYLQAPCVYSNIQTYLTQKSKALRIVKRFKYWVSASQTTDVDTSVGKIKEARIFLRHDKIYGTDYRTFGAENDTIGHAQADGDDYGVDTVHNNTPYPGSRLLMIVRAFAPERTESHADAFTPIDASKDPSYDIILRNCISTPA